MPFPTTPNLGLPLVPDRDQDWGEAMRGAMAILDGAAPTRATAAASTGTIGVGTRAEIPITLAKSCDIQKIATDYPAYVVIYNTAASRAADSARISTVDPTPGTGVLTEVTTTAALLGIPMSPVPVFVNDDATPAATCYLSVQNKDSVSRDITVTITYTQREA